MAMASLLKELWRFWLRNYDQKTIDSFGHEWHSFDQSEVSNSEISKIFSEYFSIFPFELINQNSEGFDMGCGSGRWAKSFAPLVRKLHCIDPSGAIEVARKALKSHGNVQFHESDVDTCNLKLGSQDFGYSLGVLHHIPDTAKAIKQCASFLKAGAPLLLYLYYAFDNRPLWYRVVWRISDALRMVINRLPHQIKNFVTDVLAAIIYLPLSKFSLILSKFGISTRNIPLSYYKDHSFYTMRTDSRDRFGTPLERRFSRNQIVKMLIDADLTNITFSKSAPYWCVVGYKGKSL